MLTCKIFKLRETEMIFYAFSWGYFLKKYNFGKGQRLKLLEVRKTFLKILSYSASKLRTYNHLVLTVLRQGQSKVHSHVSKKPMFSLNHSLQLTHIHYFTSSRWFRNQSSHGWPLMRTVILFKFTFCLEKFTFFTFTTRYYLS